MQLNHTTAVNATAASGVPLTSLLSVSIDIFHPIDIALRKCLGLNVYELCVQNKGLLQPCWPCPE